MPTEEWPIRGRQHDERGSGDDVRVPLRRVGAAGAQPPRHEERAGYGKGAAARDGVVRARSTDWSPSARQGAPAGVRPLVAVRGAAHYQADRARGQRGEGMTRTPDQTAAYYRAYYARHREQIAARKRAYRARHREQVAARQRAYYARHREQVAARKRAYYARHREQVAARKRAYRAAHWDKVAARQRAYYARHREQVAAYQRAYYARHREQRS